MAATANSATNAIWTGTLLQVHLGGKEHYRESIYTPKCYRRHCSIPTDGGRMSTAIATPFQSTQNRGTDF